MSLFIWLIFLLLINILSIFVKIICCTGKQMRIYSIFLVNNLCYFC